MLIVEDQPELLRALRINLRARQYDVTTARTGREALAVAASQPPDAVILDLGLPDIDGTEVIVELRRWSKAPIIVLSGRTSPGRPRQATIGRWLVNLTSHQVTWAAAPAMDPSPAADPSPHPGSGGGGGPSGGSGPEETLRLTPTEWRILEILLRRPGQLVGSAQILTGVWGPGFGQRTNYLRFHMARLRRKLEDNPARPRHLLTEPGMGYRYQP
ncbi:MAG: winged helix-turn-helix domain-containing protein [Streptosporangiaceae bacterium]